MDTTTAAAQAGVTADTIRTWCRIGAVAAIKASGKWAIDPESLAHRITLTAPVAHAISAVRGLYTARGTETALARALATGRLVRIVDGKCAGDAVYLGHHGTTYSDYGIGEQVTGCMRQYVDGRAEYAIDTTRLQHAPRLAEAIAAQEERTAILDAQRERAERAYLNPRYQ